VSEPEKEIGGSDNQWPKVRAIFDHAASLQPEERNDFLQHRCNGDDALLAEIQSLLSASESEEATSRKFLTGGLTSQGGSSDGVRLSSHASQEGSPRNEASSAERVHEFAGRQIGPYQLEQLIGRGGMGAVYLASRSDGHFEQKVAVKLIDLPLVANIYSKQFRIERQILAGLSHPFIARLLDGGVSADGELYLAMEYIDGTSILSYCDQKNLSLRDRVILFKDVCNAVQYAHQNLVIHRDLKPDNILVVADGTPRLLDFGTAKIMSEAAEITPGELTRHGLLSFTPQYASPEQVLGKPISTASDVYSLGVLLFRLLAGVPPYELKQFTTEEMLRIICAESPPRPSAVAVLPEIPDADLDSVVLKALRKEPEERYQTADQLAADLQAWLDDRPVLARRDSFRYRASKFARRNKLALGAVSVVFATVVCGAAAVFWQWRVAVRERATADVTAQEMHGLSDSFLSEIDTAVRDLPGSTPVRQLMVSRVLEHLDHLAEKTREDRTTQLYLAEAYRRLGSLQGNGYEQNLGDAQGAIVSLNKALAIIDRLKVGSHDDPILLETYGKILETRGTVYFGHGPLENGIGDIRNAINAFDQVATRPSATAEQLANGGEAYHHLGDMLGETTVPNAGDYAGALRAYEQARDSYQRALRLDPSNVRSKYEIAMYPMKAGQILTLTDPAAAIDNFRESNALWKALPLKDRSSTIAQRTIRYNDILIALSYDYLRDYEDALALARPLDAELGRIAGADPKNSQAWEDYSFILEIEARAYIDMLNPLLYSHARADLLQILPNAVATEERCAAAAEKLAAFNSDDPSWESFFALQRVLLGALKQMQNPNGDGPRLTESGITVLRQHIPPNLNSSEALQHAAAAMLAVDVVYLRDSRLAVLYAENLVALSHHSNPNDLLLLAQAYRANGESTKAVATAREGLRLLPPPKSGMRPIRSQILLQDIIDHAQPL
jgi:eukaryotic-like serine/threonine-protein kinase